MTPKALISRASYFADMAKIGAPKIPLGVYLEVVWPQNGRWFGLIGRDRLSDHERRLLSASDFPELTAPWEFLRGEFEAAWRDSVGQSLANLASKYQWALNISYPISYDLGKLYEPEDSFERLAEKLSAHLNTFQKSELRPIDPVQTAVAPALPRRMPPVRTETAALEPALEAA